MNARSLGRRLLRSAGFDLIRFLPESHPLARRAQLLRHHQIDLVLDVGANRGQYARQLRQLGYQGRIISWEPSSTAFAGLQEAAARDQRWTAINAALAAEDTTRSLHISQNDCSNSLLDMLPRHLQAAANSAYLRTETVCVQKLDSVFDSIRGNARSIFLKVDAQGAEKSVLEGATQSLPLVTLMQLELSLVPLYAGETMLTDMVQYVADCNYEIVSIEPGFVEPSTGKLLQVDVLFARS